MPKTDEAPLTAPPAAAHYEQRLLEAITRLDQHNQAAHEKQRAALAGLETRIETLNGNLARFNLEIGDRDGVFMSTLLRMERKQEDMMALAQGTAARVARLDEQRDLPISEIDKLKREVDTIKIHNRSGSKRDAAAIARLEAKVEILEKEHEKLEEDVEDTQKRQASEAIAKARELDAEVRAKEAMLRASHADLVKEDRAEKRDVHKDIREDRRHTKMWALGIIGAIVMALATALITAKLGIKADSPPAPSHQK